MGSSRSSRARAATTVAIMGREVGRVEGAMGQASMQRDPYVHAERAPTPTPQLKEQYLQARARTQGRTLSRRLLGHKNPTLRAG